MGFISLRISDPGGSFSCVVSQFRPRIRRSYGKVRLAQDADEKPEAMRSALIARFDGSDLSMDFISLLLLFLTNVVFLKSSICEIDDAYNAKSIFPVNRFFNSDHQKTWS